MSKELLKKIEDLKDFYDVKITSLQSDHNKLRDNLLDDYGRQIKEIKNTIDQLKTDTSRLKTIDELKERAKMHRRWQVTTSVAIIAILSSIFTPIVVNKYFKLNNKEQNIVEQKITKKASE